LEVNLAVFDRSVTLGVPSGPSESEYTIICLRAAERFSRETDVIPAEEKD
jgi:hypothetical protein